MSELIDRERFSADMRDFQNRVGIWRDEAEDTETRTRADAALATIIETKLILDKQPTIPAPRWHRVEEPPKEDGKYVAINVKTKWWYEASYENGNWKAVDLFGQRWVVIHPTHWMPIEPPKEDA